jgi:hypothetical protein
MTPEEQQYYDQLMGNSAVTESAKEYDKEPDISIEEYGKQLGMDVNKIKQDIAQEDSMQMGPMGKPMAAEADLAGFIKGAGQGVADIAQNVLNFGVDIADGIENFAASHGVGKGDVITDADRIDWAAKLGSPEDSLVTRATRQVTKYGAPVVATMGAGGGVMAGLGAGAAIDLLTLDPKQERLSTILRDQVPELKNFPIAYKALDYLSNKPDEGAFEGRFKNMIEGLGIAAPIAGVFSGISKAGRAMKNIGNDVKAATEAGASKTGIITSAANAEVKAAKLAEGMPAPSAATEPLQGDLFNYAATKEIPEKGPSFNLNNDNVVEFAAQYAKANPKAPEELYRGPKAFAELDAEAQGIIKDQSKLDALLGWKLGDRPLTDAEVKASQYLMSNTYENVVDSAIKASISGTEDDLLHLSNMLETFKYIDSARSGAGSEAGRALNAHKLSADLMNTSIDAFNANLTAQGRIDLVKNALDAGGGKESLQDIAKTIRAISEMPDANVAKALSQMPKVGGIKATADILQAVAINGMLSSPKTVVSNTISNALTTTISALTNYGATGIGFVRGSTDGMKLSAANSYIRGMMSGMLEGFSAAGQALKTGRGGPANIIKGDFAMPINAISAEALGVPVEQNFAYKIIGKVVDTTGLAVGLPSRINATSDAFWGTVMYRGKVYEEATTAAERLGLTGKEASDFINAKVKDVPVGIHESAQKFAQENTFSKALDDQSFAGKVDGVIEKVPMGRVVLPFFKTSANIIDYSFKHSPLAPFSTPIREAIMRGGKEGDIALSKVIVGTTMLGGAAYLASQGIITGPDTNNYKVKQALEESGLGWQPDSIKVGDNYVNISRVDPFSSFLRLGAVMSQLRNFVSDDEYEQLASVAGGAVVDFLTPEMMIDGYSRLFEAYNEAARYDSKDKVVSVMADIGSRFVPFSALQRDIKNQIDPYKGSTAIVQKDAGFLDKFTDKLINRYKSISPWHSTDLPIQRNIFGEPLLVPDGAGPDIISPFAITKAGGSEVVQKLQALAGYKETVAPDDNLPDLRIEMPSKQWSPGGAVAAVKIELRPAEYERYIMYSAGIDPDTNKPLNGMQPLRGAVEDVLKAMKNVDTQMSPLEYQKMAGKLSSVFLKYRKVGQQMMSQDPKIMERWNKAFDAATSKQTIDAFQ